MVNSQPKSLYKHTPVGLFTCTFTPISETELLYSGYANGSKVVPDMRLSENDFVQLWNDLLNKGYRKGA